MDENRQFDCARLHGSDETVAATSIGTSGSSVSQKNGSRSCGRETASAEGKAVTRVTGKSLRASSLQASVRRPSLPLSSRTLRQLGFRHRTNGLQYAAGGREPTQPHIMDLNADGAQSVNSTGRAGVTAAWLFPGLGCRHVGMGADLFGGDPIIDQMIVDAEQVLGYEIRPICLEGSGRKYVPFRKEAEVIYVLECAYATSLMSRGVRPVAVCGHSLGSLAAGFACGAFNFLTGLSLVSYIEDLLEQYADGFGHTMAVILGLDADQIRHELSSRPAVYIANWNSPHQFVVAGPETDVLQVLTSALAQGAKQARKMPVGRAMHTPYLESLGASLRARLGTMTWTKPEVPFVSCHDGSVRNTEDEVQGFFAEFLWQPVIWPAAIQSLRKGWGTEFVEVGPGQLLTTMASFIDRGLKVQSSSNILQQNGTRT